MLDAVSGGEELELLEGDDVLAAEVPLDQVVEFILHKLEPTPLNQISKLINRHTLCLLVLDSVEEAFEEHIVLLLVGELGLTCRFEGAHELAELLLVDLAIAVCVPFQVLHQGIEETVLRLLIVLVVDGPFE